MYHQVNFECPTKLYIGGKWICDPARIISIADEEAQQNKPPQRLKKKVASQKECIIYISGGNEIDFANQFLEFSKARMTELHNDISGEDENGLLACELHIFAPHGQVSCNIIQYILYQISSVQLSDSFTNMYLTTRSL